MRHPILLLLVISLSFQARSESPLGGASSIALTELFDVEKQSGAGSLEFQLGEKKESVVFSSEAGHYGLGMVFPGASLPSQYGKDFKNEQILQIAFGTMRSSLSGQLPQFSAATLIASKIPTKPTRFQFVMPSAKGNPETNIAFLLFTSPATPNDRSDEEKLKGTLFAQKGSITFSPQTEWAMKERPYQNGKMQFKVMVIKMEIDAELGTPFSTEKGTLKGVVEIPLYLPHGKSASVIARQLASSSLQGAPEPLPADGKLPKKKKPKK